MKAHALIVALAIAAWLPTASPQPSTEEVVRLDAQLERTLLAVQRAPTPPYVAEFRFTYNDVSIESFNPATPGLDYHLISASVTWNPGADTTNWQLDAPTYSPTQLRTGEGGSGFFRVVHQAGVTSVAVDGTLNVTLTSGYTQRADSVLIPWRVQILPSPGVQIQAIPLPVEKVAPYGTAKVPVRITNIDAYPASFRVGAYVLPGDGIEPADVSITGIGTRYLEAGESQIVVLDVIAPRSKFWYADVPMVMFVTAAPAAGGSELSVVQILTISGVYWNESLILLIVVALLQVFLLIWLIAFAKRRYEQRYLGRPIPPWKIPEEAANLERLKRDEPRAHYVTRYFLMVEEHRSALLWFEAYKKISKRQLKAEIKAVEYRERAEELSGVPAEKFDKASSRVQRRYMTRLERAEESTQERIQRLKARLERDFEKDFEKQHETWKERVETLQTKHNKPYLKAKAKWEKQSEKILAKWEKPFRKQKEKHAKALAKAKEAYAAKVKKADKTVWRAWREQMEDWEQENKLRRKEGRELVPEPELFSAAIGPADLPAPFVEPPRPDLPPEPTPQSIELPPEPTLGTPDLWTSGLAKKARKVQKQGAKQVRSLELQMAEKLNELHHKREGNVAKVGEKREKLLAASSRTQKPSLVDKALRRSPEAIEARHHVALIRGQTQEKVKDLEEMEQTRVDQVRIEGEREQAELEAKILVERAAVHRAQKTGTSQERATESEKLASLLRQLGEAKQRSSTRLAEARRASKQRLEEGIAKIKEDARQRIERETGRPAPDEPAAPS